MPCGNLAGSPASCYGDSLSRKRKSIDDRLACLPAGAVIMPAFSVTHNQS